MATRAAAGIDAEARCGRRINLWPGEGSINWKEAMELLRTAPQTPPLLLEIESDEKVNPLEKIGAAFEKLEKD